MSSKKPKVAALQTKPTTVTSGFGTGSYNPATGQVGYTLADPLAQMRDVFYGAAQDFLPSEQQQQFASQVGDFGRGLFSGATQYDLGQMTSDYYNQQQNILRPERDLESAALSDRMFGTGRLGYGAGTEGGYINPQQFALQKARESQNAQLAMGAEDRARGIQNQDIMRGLGLINSESALNMNPYSQAQGLFGMGTNIEGLGYNTLGTVGQFSPMQLQWQGALQANQQAQNNAKASGGFGGLLGGVVNAGLNYATGGGSGLFSSVLGGLGNWSGSGTSDWGRSMGLGDSTLNPANWG
jgi:hypothetical protein